ncbi:MAG: Xaa-Pro dipeptidase [Pseudomonadales bacterium]|jgi:Xaa-Pro dipeptidase|nr:Xaa-Pro dipeptidase [Pseudomonadales bacterium]
MSPRSDAFMPPEDPELFAAHLAIVRDRYERAMAGAGVETLVIDAGGPTPWYRDDIAGDWRVNPHFRLFTPLAPAEGCTLVLRPAQRPLLLQLAPADYWHLPPSTPTGCWTAAFEIETVADTTQREARIAALAGNRSARIGPGTDDVPDALLTAVDHARARKTAWELECLRRASARAVAGHDAAAAAFRAGASEYEIQLAYLRATAHEDAELPYRNIVALDEHCAVLHYQFKDRTVPPGDGRRFLLDAGADVGGYAADVTRTHAREAGAFADLITLMDELQHGLLGDIAPGVPWVELHRRTHERLAGVLLEAGLAEGSREALVADGVTGHFLPHGLGHLLGTQTHDVGGQLAGPEGGTVPPPADFPALRLTRTLAEDYVVTVEPGLYFIPLLLDELRGKAAGRCVRWDAVDALAPFGGIRIEDDVRVTADGIENLTRDAFAALEAGP